MVAALIVIIGLLIGHFAIQSKEADLAQYLIMVIMLEQVVTTVKKFGEFMYDNMITQTGVGHVNTP